jgi:hypothetical protein
VSSTDRGDTALQVAIRRAEAAEATALENLRTLSSQRDALLARAEKAEAARDALRAQESYLTERIHGTGPGGGLVGELAAVTKRADELQASLEHTQYLRRLDGEAAMVVERERDALRAALQAVPHTCGHHPHLGCGRCIADQQLDSAATSSAMAQAAKS